MNALVTGASGFAGSRLANALVQRGYKVYGFVRPMSNVSNLSTQITLIQGDLTSQASVDGAIQDMDIVYHIAATYRDSGVSQQTYYDVNVMGTRHVIEACLAHKVNRMVHCSTIGVHGHIENPPATEQSPFKSVSKKASQATFREGCPPMNALIFLEKAIQRNGAISSYQGLF